jgi:hypothetical protein
MSKNQQGPIDNKIARLGSDRFGLFDISEEKQEPHRVPKGKLMEEIAKHKKDCDSEDWDKKYSLQVIETSQPKCCSYRVNANGEEDENGQFLYECLYHNFNAWMRVRRDPKAVIVSFGFGLSVLAEGKITEPTLSALRWFKPNAAMEIEKWIESLPLEHFEHFDKNESAEDREVREKIKEIKERMRERKK